ncbi:hypothetical protein Q1695_009532 [Nippostrongylus brasiliensis]|nr:hypothetical protein Q1695_009532 [Nippostrongylus brasiliensis]
MPPVRQTTRRGSAQARRAWRSLNGPRDVREACLLKVNRARANMRCQAATSLTELGTVSGVGVPTALRRRFVGKQSFLLFVPMVSGSVEREQPLEPGKGPMRSVGTGKVQFYPGAAPLFCATRVIYGRWRTCFAD